MQRRWYVLGGFIAFLGFVVRIKAFAWSQPRPGPDWSDPIYGFWQQTYVDLGLILLGFGLTLILINFNRHLKRLENQTNTYAK